MGEIINPYIAGAPVTEQRMFFGREDVFTWIENSLSGQYADHILVVHGQRRVGKTSVLKQLGNRLPKRYIPVFFDLQGRTHTTLDRFLWWLAREIARVLKQERGIEVPVPEKDTFTADPEYFETKFLTGLRPMLGENSLLLTFDEFDNLEESEIKEELARPLVDYLRRMMGEAGLNFIFSIGSSGRKLENMQASYTEFFKTALYKKISFLARDQTAHLITKPVEGVLEYERGAVEMIFETTFGHPYFTQLMCHELFARCQRTEQRRVAKSDVEAILEDVVERGTVNLKFVWDEATDIEKWSLAALANMEGKNDNRALADFLRKNRVRFSETDLSSGLLHLREKDVLTAENRFVIGLLRLWLQKNRPIEQAREELTEVNPIANRYIEIGLEFKDSHLYEKAIESFQEALAISKDNIQAQVNIALVYMDQKAHDKAVVEFEKALVMDDEDVSARAGLCEAHLALGDSALGRGRMKEAMLSYQRVLGINAEHTEARQRMAEISRQRAEKALAGGKDEEALSAFAEALRFTPEDGSLIERAEKVRAEKKAKVLAALVARSEKEASARGWEKSLSALSEALELAPQDESILAKIESVKTRQLRDRLNAILAKVDQAEKAGRWDAAIGALNEYLALQPDNKIQKRLDDLKAAKRTAWLGAVGARADVAVASERWDEVLAALNEVLSLEPDNAEIAARVEEACALQKAAALRDILRRAEQAALAGRWDEAIESLNAGLASEPENETLQAKLAEVRKAKREARLKATLRLADTAAQAGKWESAVEALNEVLAVEPDNAEFQKKLSEVRALERASKLNAERTQARSLARAERFDESLKAWDEYMKLSPDDREAAQAEIESVKKAQTLAHNYAEAYKAYSKKNYEKAIGLFKTIVMEDADYKDASRLLAESVELRRTTRKWWQSKWMWGSAVGLIVLVTGWFAIRPGSPLMNILLAAPLTTPAGTSTINTSLPTLSAATARPTVTAVFTPIPLAWKRLNSGQFLSRDFITAIVIDPNDPGVMYIGTNNAGIYKSIDGGISWQPIHNGLGRAVIYSLIMDPSDTQVLYAGTLLGGVYKTTDGGLTWNEVNAGISRRHEWVAILVMDHQDVEHLYFTDAGGLFETLDGGNSWQEIKTGNCPEALVGLVVDPADGNTLYGAEFGSEDCEGGIYKSTDGGESWKITGLISKRQNDIQWGALWIEPTAGKTIYTTAGGQLWVSFDSGDTWTESGLSCHVLAFSAQNQSTVYCGSGDDIKKTTDGGRQWNTIINTGNGQATNLAVAPKNENILFWGESELFVSMDGGKTSQKYGSGLGGNRLELKSLPSNASVMYAQASDHSIYTSMDSGRNWIVMDSVSSGRSMYFDKEGKTIFILYEGEEDGIGISEDNGETWAKIAFPLPSPFPDSIAGHPIINRLYALYHRDMPPYIHYSDDLGVTWLATEGMQNIHDPRLFFDHDHGDVVYVVGDMEISRSSDGGMTWDDCARYPSDIFWVSSLDARAAIDRRDSDRVLVATRGEGIVVSNDGCQSWQASNDGLDSLFVNTLATDPNNPDTIYAATEGGAYVSTDGGETWGKINDGLLGATVVYSIVVDKDSNVYAATPYGIFILEGKK